MARAGAAVVLFAAVCCLLVAPAPARRPVELPPQVIPDAVDREAAAEPLLRKPVPDAEAADPTTDLAVPEEGEEVGPARQLSSLLCLVFRCGGDAVALSSSEEPPSLDRWAELVGKENGQERPCDPDSDSDWDSDSDDEVGDDGQERPCDSDYDCDSDWVSDSDDEGGIVGWFWRLARRFY